MMNKNVYTPKVGHVTSFRFGEKYHYGVIVKADPNEKTCMVALISSKPSKRSVMLKPTKNKPYCKVKSYIQCDNLHSYFKRNCSYFGRLNSNITNKVTEKVEKYLK